MQEITQTISIMFLIELVNLAKSGKAIPKQFGLNSQTVKDLSTMNMFEIQTLSKSPFFDVNINERYLSQITQKIIDERSSNHTLDQALVRGATRRIMKKYANMSYKEFNAKRNLLNLDKKRSRPSNLNMSDYEKLGMLHSEYGQFNPIVSKFDHLRTMVFLAERTNLDINRIYQYFYVEHENMYLAVSS